VGRRGPMPSWMMLDAVMDLPDRVEPSQLTSTPHTAARTQSHRGNRASAHVRPMTARSADNLRTKLRGRTLTAQASGL
jgi:hypothetical protein